MADDLQQAVESVEHLVLAGQSRLEGLELGTVFGLQQNLGDELLEVDFAVLDVLSVAEDTTTPEQPSLTNVVHRVANQSCFADARQPNQRQ